MSPEQCGGDTVVDHRTDLYAMGCLLHEMITGTPPFGFGGAGELVRAHVEEPPPRLSDGEPGVPPVLDALAQKLLAKDPADRPASCRDVIEAIDACGLADHTLAALPRSVVVDTVIPTAARLTSPAPPAGWRATAWRRLRDLSPGAAAGWTCAVGALLLGASTVAGVGDSYIAEPNWGFTYAVLVPIMVSFALRVVQRVDAALGEMAARGMIASRAGGDPAVREVGDARRQLGESLVSMSCGLAVVSVAISVGEWLHRYLRAPIPGTWWSQSAVIGAAGAVCQGLLTAVILVFVIHSISWAQLIHGWTSPRAALRLQVDRNSVDARRGFELLEEPLVLALVTALLVGIMLYLSNVMHLAEVRHESFLAVLLPSGGLALTGPNGLLDAGSGRYPSTTTLVASAMVVLFSLASLFVLARSIAAATDHRHAGWPLGSLRLTVIAVLLAGMTAGTICFRMGPLVGLAIVAVAVWQASVRRARAAT